MLTNKRRLSILAAIIVTIIIVSILLFIFGQKKPEETISESIEQSEEIVVVEKEALPELIVTNVKASNPRFKVGESVSFFVTIKNAGETEVNSWIEFQVDYLNDEGIFEYASSGGGDYKLEPGEEVIIETAEDCKFMMPNSSIEIEVNIGNKHSYQVTLDGFVEPVYLHTMTIDGEDTFLVNNTNWELVWNDEFSNNEIDKIRWSFEEGYVRNYEPQFYTTEVKNIRIEDGNLVLSALREDDATYTSASINTNESFNFQYGRIEMKAKLPKGPGMQPIAWLMTSNYNPEKWDKNGQITIFNMLGGNTEDEGDDSCVQGGIEYKLGQEKKSTINKADYVLSDGSLFADDYHVFAVEWSTERIEWFVDGVKYHSIEISSEKLIKAFNIEKFLNISLSMSLDKGGDKDNNQYPQDMYVDYIRVYRQKDKHNGQLLNGDFNDGVAFWDTEDSIETVYYDKATDSSSFVLKLLGGNRISQNVTGLHSYAVYELRAKLFNEAGALTVIGIKGAGVDSHVGEVIISDEGVKEIVLKVLTGSDVDESQIYIMNNGNGVAYIDEVSIEMLQETTSNIRNGSFEAMETKQFTSPNNRVMFTDKNPYTGKKAAYLPAVDKGTSLEYRLNDLMPYSTYTISMMVQQVKDDANGQGGILGVRNHDGARAQFVECSSSEYGEYKEATLTFTTGKVDLNKVLYFSVGHKGEAYIDDLHISGPGIPNVYTEEKQLSTTSGSLLPIDMMKTKEIGDKAIEYELFLPEGFEYVKKETLDIYKGIDRLFIQLPSKLRRDKFTIKMIASSEGERISESFITVNVLDAYTVENMTAKVANTSLFQSYEVVVPITNNSTSEELELTLQGLSHPLANTVTLTVEPNTTKTVLLPLNKFPTEENVTFKMKVLSDNTENKVIEQVLINQPIGQGDLWTLAFHDEFDGDELDESKWNYNWVWGDTCAHSPEILSKNNVQVDQGILKIMGTKKGDKWYSGMIQTNGIHNQMYGYWEARIKTVDAVGFLNAFWLCTDKHWPPEIDIVEVKGNNPFAAHMTMHYMHANGSATAAGNEWKSAKDLSSDYNIFGCKWTPEKITYYVNGAPVVSFDNQIYEPLYTLLNMHIGMDWTGAPISDESQTFSIDWVRIWTEQ